MSDRFGAYRGDHETETRTSIRQLEARLEHQESRLDAHTRRFLGPDRERLQLARQAARQLRDRGAEPLEQLKALERYGAVLDQVLARKPALKRALERINPGVPELEMFAEYRPADDFTCMPFWVGDTFHNVEQIISRFDLNIRAETLDQRYLRGFKIEFRYQDMPFLLGYENQLVPATSLPASQLSMVATRVSLGLPRLLVVPEKARHTLLLKPLRLVQDLPVGDRRFDRVFLVQAELQQDLAMVSPQVREGLLAIIAHAPPQLRVKRGVARLSWPAEPCQEAILAALAVLQALRRTSLSPDKEWESPTGPV